MKLEPYHVSGQEKIVRFPEWEKIRYTKDYEYYGSGIYKKQSNTFMEGPSKYSEKMFSNLEFCTQSNQPLHVWELNKDILGQPVSLKIYILFIHLKKYL